MFKNNKIIIASIFTLISIFGANIAHSQSPTPTLTPIIITWDTPESIVYGTALSNTQLNAKANMSGRFVYSPSSGTILAPGTHELSLRFDPSDTSRNSVTKKVNIVVTKKFLTIRANNAEKEQGTANPGFTATYTGFVNGDTVSSSLREVAYFNTTATKDSPIGTYDIIPTGAVSDYYAFNYLRGTLTVVAPVASPNYYEISTNVTGRGTVSCIGCGKSVKEGTNVTAIATPALKHKISSWSGLGSSCSANSNSCVVEANANGDIIVNFAEIQPKLTSFTITPQTTALGGGDISLLAVTDENVGPTSYYIKIYENGVDSPIAKCGSGDSCGAVLRVTSSKTYTARVEMDGAGVGIISQLTGAVTVPGKTNPVVTWNTPESIVYGTTLSNTQLNATANVPGSFVYTPAAGTVLDGGNQTLSVTFNPTDTVKYNSITKTVTQVVTKKFLTIKANDTTKEQGKANPQFTATYTGFVNNDTVGSLDEGPSLVTDAKTSSPVGTYDIVPSGAQSSNYAFNYLRGKLTIVSSATLNAGLSADPSTGMVPPNFVTTLTGSRSGTATGVANYSFKCKDTDVYSIAKTDTQYVCIYSSVGTYNASVSVEQGGKIATYTLPITVTTDTTPPVVSDIVAGPITDQKVTIKWNTDESATSQIEYGKTAAYGLKTLESSALTLTHSQVITGLPENTTYHYRIISKDAYGNITRTADQIFKTAFPPDPEASAVSGWAWSSNIGWISFNSNNVGSKGGIYSVRLADISNGTAKLQGYAWSSNIGWIQFGGLAGAVVAGETVTDATINVKYGDPNFGKVTGWARALSANPGSSSNSSSGSGSGGSTTVVNTKTYYCKSASFSIPGNLRYKRWIYACSEDSGFTITNDWTGPVECIENDDTKCRPLIMKMTELKRNYCSGATVNDINLTSFTCTTVTFVNNSSGSSSSSNSSAGGWDGWIKLSGTYHESPDTEATKGTKGVTYYTVDKNDISGNRVKVGYLRGYAWGGEVIGWINFISEVTGDSTFEPVCISNCNGVGSGSTDYSLNTIKNITIDISNKSRIVPVPGTVSVGRIGDFTGIVTLSTDRDGSRLPADAVIGTIPQSTCILSSAPGQTTCNVSISVSNITMPGTGYYVKVNASHGAGTKTTNVPIDIIDNASNLKMWIKDGTNDRNETISAKKVRLGDSVDVAWRTTVSGLNSCVGRLNDERVVANAASVGSHRLSPSELGSVGVYEFKLECNSLLGRVSAGVYNSNGIKISDVLQITVTNSKIQEI